MSKLVCDICGGKLIMADNRQSSACESCGVEYTLNAMKDMMAALEGVELKVQGISTTQSLVDYAYSFIDTNVDEAEAQFKGALKIDSKCWQAWEGLFSCDYRRYHSQNYKGTIPNQVYISGKVDLKGVIIKEYDVSGYKKVISWLSSGDVHLEEKTREALVSRIIAIRLGIRCGFVDAFVKVCCGKEITREDKYEWANTKEGSALFWSGIYYEIGDVDVSIIETSIDKRFDDMLTFLNKAIEYSDGFAKENLEKLRSDLTELSNDDIDLFKITFKDFVQKNCALSFSNYGNTYGWIVDKASIIGKVIRSADEQKAAIAKAIADKKGQEWAARGWCYYCGNDSFTIFGKKCRRCGKQS